MKSSSLSFSILPCNRETLTVFLIKKKGWHGLVLNLKLLFLKQLCVYVIICLYKSGEWPTSMWLEERDCVLPKEEQILPIGKDLRDPDLSPWTSVCIFGSFKELQYISPSEIIHKYKLYYINKIILVHTE